MLQSEATHEADRPLRLENRVRILVADDDPDIRSILVTRLAGEGYTVEEVGSGYEFVDYIAAAEINRCRPDVILSDVKMPGFDGLALLATLRRVDWRMPVILMTAFGGDEVIIRAMEHDAVTVLDKPFDLSELMELVGAVIGMASPDRDSNREAS